MAGFGGPQARAHRARQKRRAFRRGRFKILEVAMAFDVEEHIIRYMVRNKQIPFEKVGGKLWLNSESVSAAIARGLHLKL